MKSTDEMRRILAEKATEDEEFRNQLLASPREVIAKEFDVEIPEELEIQVHEDRPDAAHLVLPPSPRLDEAQLAGVAGGKEQGLYWCL